MPMLKFETSHPKRYKNLIFLMVWLLYHGQMAMAEASIVVVANKNSLLPRLSQEEVAALFLGKYKSSNGIKVTPIDSTDERLRERFYMDVANMNPIRVKAYWSRIVFSGQGRPPLEVTAAEARTRLAKEQEVLIYLPATQVQQNMKVIFSLP